MRAVIDKGKIKELLTRGVDKIYPSTEALEKILLSGRKLKIYQGFDPTGDKLHLGHMVGLRKHKQWQELGHEVIFLIGDGTGQAGDPTGKKSARREFFTSKELRKNAENYLNQAKKIVNFKGSNPVKIMYNGNWLNKLKLPEILKIAQNFTVQRFIERDMFQERLKANEPIYLREFLYPLLQGYDSVFLNVDLELGGTDQTFNMLVGRTLARTMKNKDKFVMTTPLLSDSKGVKIGKTEDNVIALVDGPEDLFGKIMSLGDDMIMPMFTLLTDVPMSDIENFDIKKEPMNLKKRVAYTIVSQLHSKEEADKAEKNFSNTFQQHKIPDKLTEIKINGRPIDVIVASGATNTTSAARVLLQDGAVTDMTTNKKLTLKDEFENGHVYKIGTHTFIKTKKK